MPRFRVVARETATSTYIVEAANEQEIYNLAEGMDPIPQGADDPWENWDPISTDSEEITSIVSVEELDN